MFNQCLLVAIAVNCENSSESDKLLVNERDSECHKAVVSDSEMREIVSVTRLLLVIVRCYCC